MCFLLCISWPQYLVFFVYHVFVFFFINAVYEFYADFSYLSKCIHSFQKILSFIL